jgi:hypothetical protein
MMAIWCARFGVFVSVLAAAAVTAAATPASPSAATAHFDATLSATATGGGGWCCGSFVEFEGNAVVPGAGALEFTGEWLHGCSFPLAPTPCFRRLDLVLVARNGDRLAIRGNNEWTYPVDAPPQVLTWSSDPASSSGRFTDFVASGTFVVVEAGPGLEIELTGERLLGRAR